MTKVPPMIVLTPGFSLSINHASIGARTASNRINNDTSDEVINLGPVVIKHIAIGAKSIPKMKI